LGGSPDLRSPRYWSKVQVMFDDLADVYEAMIDWPKRLAHETPFYRRLFQRLGLEKMGTGSVPPSGIATDKSCPTVPVPIFSGSVLDAACGTGQHAAMFHSWGLRVEGADLSAAMIDRARGAFGEPDGLRWTVRAFDEPIVAETEKGTGSIGAQHPEGGQEKGTGSICAQHPQGRSGKWCLSPFPAEPFDVAICVGNSLALAPDMATVGRAVHQMLAAVRPGGAVVVQVLNLWRLPDGPCVWQKCRRATLPSQEKGTGSICAPHPQGRPGKWCLSPFPSESQGDILILKGVHRSGTRGYVDWVVADPAVATLLRTESTPLLGLEASELERLARDARATTVTFYGGYDDQPYDRQESVDLIMVAER
jgi:SAM-dependent methyltransferase